MKINEASDFFESLINKAGKKSEIKIYESFVGILSDLKNKNLTENQLQSIEEELDGLELNSNPGNKKKYYRKKLSGFKTYLKDKFSLITEGYYTAIGMSLGVSFGVVFGTIFKETIGISIGIAIGMFIGLIFGKYLDSEAEKQNRVLKAKLN
jgi:hypothetical protein